MAMRTVALCDGKFIGIETIYIVIDGKQINIPEKLKELRAKSQKNELFCPCGCGANLVLVAGDKNLREQHFRIKAGQQLENCTYTTESKTSVDSKIVLKCCLDDKLQADDLESRVPICDISDSERRYEFSFISKKCGIALDYCHNRANLSYEKQYVLEQNTQIWVSGARKIDCSGFVSYVINNCGNRWSVGRKTANGLLGCCTWISAADAKPGDLIFFQGTYNTSGASHVGIYVGDGMMLHCGNPIQYASVNSRRTGDGSLSHTNETFMRTSHNNLCFSLVNSLFLTFSFFHRDII